MNRNKKMTKKFAVAIAGVMMAQAGAPLVYAGTASDGNTEAVYGKTVISADQGTSGAENTSVSKEETVYVKADAAGTVQEIIVSDWLKNSEGKASISDQSDLKDIENVKGEEGFSSDGQKMTWDANGQDIYYQGSTQKELPVTVRATYYLDGRKILPEELAGKSGHLKICYTYENKLKNNDVYTPFTMATGLVLPSENFKNVKVNNGKVISDGEKEIAVGIGFPGMAESLKLQDTELLKDVKLPETFEIEADVTDCKLAMTMTVAVPLNLDTFGLDEIEGMEDLEELFTELTDAATQLVDGSGELADGVKTLQDACTELIDGMNTVDENMGTLASGIATLNEKKDDLTAGIGTLADGIGTLNDKKSMFVQGVGDLASGATELRKGMNTVKKGSKELAGNSKKLEAGAKELASGSGSKQLTEGSKALVEGSKELAQGSQTLADGITALVEGEDGKKLLAGGQALETGSQSLVKNLGEYTDGVDQIAEGLPGYVDGVDQYMQSVQNYVGAVNGLLDGITAGSTTTSVDSGTQQRMIAEVEQIAVGEPEVQQVSDIVKEQIYREPVVKAEAQVTKTTINEEAVENIQTVLANLQDVQNTINGATTKEDLIRLYASYDAYVAELNDCITLLSGALGGIQEETIDTVTMEQTVEQTIEQPVQTRALMAAPQVIMETTGGGDGTGSDAQMQMDQAVLAQTAAALRGAGTQLTEGEEIQALKLGGSALKDGAVLLGAADPQTGATASQMLTGGAQQLSEGAVALHGGVSAVFEAAATQLKPGADALALGLGSLAEGADALDSGLEQLLGGAQTLDRNLEKFAAATASLSAGTNKLYSGAKELENGTDQLNSGAAILSAGIVQLADGSVRLASGAGELADGVQQLADGSAKLKDGTAQLAEGGEDLDEGVEDLKNGADELRDGMKEFNEKGIEKITDFLEEDVQELLDRLEAVQTAGEDYKLFSDSGNMDGNVKFIIETAAIE
ncbi:hypothetical protein D7Y05_13730 [bacterium 1XD42-54]|nr:hypothetical protein D7Y05_13730 [bacterium 1XD42-54]